MNIVDIFQKFPDQQASLAYLERVRWPNGPICPYCKSDRSSPLPAQRRHHCNNCNTTYSVTVRTIFHHTHMPLQKWFLAASIILNAKKGVSARQLARHLKVNRNTAWRIAMKIREAMAEREHRELLHRIVEMDETYIGGKPRKSGPKDKTKALPGRGTKKIPIVGMRERGGNVKARVVKDRKLGIKRLFALVREHVDIAESILVTDGWSGYNGIRRFMPHWRIDHGLAYVDGEIHTNSVESFLGLAQARHFGPVPQGQLAALGEVRGRVLLSVQ